MKNLGLYYRTIKHLKSSQLAYRLINKIKRETFAKAPVLVSLISCRGYKKWKPILNPLAEKTTVAHFNSTQLTFTFLNQEREWKYNWFPNDAELLWLFNLHYFEYAFELTPQQFIEITESWIEHVPECHKVAWHPYPLSRRVCNWIWYFSKHHAEFPEVFKITLLKSLSKQLAFLSSNLEYDLLGNHLLANLTATVISSSFFGNQRLLKKNLRALKKQLRIQVLSDGGHFELTPSYHKIVLGDLIAISFALKDPPAWLKDSIQKMAHFLNTLTGPYELPLLNDSSSEVGPPVDELLQLSSKVAGWSSNQGNLTHHLKDSGLFIHSSSKMRCIFDIGKIGPDYLPGHAHNDQLSILLDIADRTILADSGVFTYKDSPERQYFRSCSAHNTVCLGGEEPNELWKSFRAGRRGYPVDVQVNLAEKTASAGITSYQFLQSSLHRTVKVMPEDDGILITTTVQSSRRHLSLAETFHLHPSVYCKSTAVDGKYTIHTIEADNLLVFLVVENFGKSEVSESFYSPEFGIKKKRAAIINSGFLEKEKISWNVIITTNPNWRQFGS